MSKQYDRWLSEDVVTEYTKKESLQERFDNVYNTFLDSDVQKFKKQIEEMNSIDFAKFMVHVIEEMRVDPREIVRTLKSII